MPAPQSLDLGRYIARIRNERGNNWQALALQDIQDYVNQLPVKAGTTTINQTAVAASGGGSPTPAASQGTIVSINGKQLASANFNGLSPPAVDSLWQLVTFQQNAGTNQVSGTVPIAVTLGTDAARAALTLSGSDNGALWITTDTMRLWQVQSAAWVDVTPWTPEVAKSNLLAQGADVVATTAYAVPAALNGVYRVTVFIIVSRAATVASTLPAVNLIWTDQDSGATITQTAVTPPNAGNSLSTFQQASFDVNAAASTNIQFSTTGYASSGATSMQFALRVRVEALS